MLSQTTCRIIKITHGSVPTKLFECIETHAVSFARLPNSDGSVPARLFEYKEKPLRSSAKPAKSSTGTVPVRRFA